MIKEAKALIVNGRKVDLKKWKFDTV